jgi:hypothetical protein
MKVSDMEDKIPLVLEHPVRKDGKNDSKKDDSPDDSSSTCMMVPALLDMSTVGMATDSGKSISTDRRDFLWIDESTDAKNSCNIAGIGESKSRSCVGGRGPMAVQVLNSCGQWVLMIDPEGVYYIKNSKAPHFRVFAQMQMKKLGLRLVQCFENTDTDVLECRKTKMVIHLHEDNEILVCKTKPIPKNHNLTQAFMDSIMRGDASPLVCLSNGSTTPASPTPVSSTMINVARLSQEALARLWHWRLGHPAADVPLKMNEGVTFHLNEDCYCCDESKFKTGSFPRNEPLILQNNPPFWRVYADG